MDEVESEISSLAEWAWIAACAEASFLFYFELVRWSSLVL